MKQWPEDGGVEVKQDEQNVKPIRQNVKPTGKDVGKTGKKGGVVEAERSSQ